LELPVALEWVTLPHLSYKLTFSQYEWLRQLSQDSNNTVIGLARSVDKVQVKLEGDSIKNVHLVKGDMSDSNSMDQAAVEVSKITSGVDYLIVNGAYNPLETRRFNPSEYTGRAPELREEMVESLNVNLLGVVYSINSFLSLIRKGSEKKITVISTGMADAEQVVEKEIPGSLVYASMKAATNMVVAKYAVELKKEGIVVLALSPGVINTHEGPGKYINRDIWNHHGESNMSIVSDVDMQAIMVMMQKFQAALPHWTGPATAAQSVSAQRKVIESITLEQTGQFLSHKGNKEWL
jgi:NAD(P)-dependent dehydrogenase (short-subunit alcohol dehydrogenase family)